MYVCARMLPSISIDNGILLALQFGSICKSFGIVQWSRALFRHCSWVAIAKVLDYFSSIERFDDLGMTFWRPHGVKSGLERRFWWPGSTKLALESRFGWRTGAKLALERRFRWPDSVK